jgi:hypothetical protein
VNLVGSPVGQAANVLRTECADLIKAAGVLRQIAQRQAGYMHADRFDIGKKKLAKGVGSIHARSLQFPQHHFDTKAPPYKAHRIVQVRLLNTTITLDAAALMLPFEDRALTFENSSSSPIFFERHEIQT